MQKEENVTYRSSEFWGICCESGKKYSQVVRQKFHITMAALDPNVVPTSPIVSLIVDRGGCEYLLCSLKPGSILQVNLNLYFDKGEKVTFSLRGHGKIHLSGYHIYEKNELFQSEIAEKSHSVSSIQKSKVSAMKGNDKSKTNTTSAKVSDTSSDEVEEINKDLKKGHPLSPVKKPTLTAVKKDSKPKVSSVNADDTDDSSEEEEETKKAVPATAKMRVLSPKKDKKAVEESDEDSFDGLDDTSEDEESEEENKDSNKDSKKLQTYKRLWSSLTQSEEEEESESSESDEDEEISKKGSKDFQNRKKLKNDSSTPIPNKKIGKNTPKKSAEVINLDEETSSIKKTPKKNDALMNSSIGRTPMPQKKILKTNQANLSSGNLASKKVNFADSDESSDSDSDLPEVSVKNKGAAVGKIPVSDKKAPKTTQVNLSPKKVNLPQAEKKPSDLNSGIKNSSFSATPSKGEQLNESSSLTESKKKKKKKKKSKNAMDTSNVSDDGSNKTGKSSLSSPTFSKKLAGGIAYEDIRVGNGPIAKTGRIVHMYYTGKLEDKTVFDSRKPGGKPFSFKLGSGSVVKGWDIAIEGMKVGGKRVIRVPPSLGHQFHKVGTIPQNSALYYIVELKAVS